MNIEQLVSSILWGGMFIVGGFLLLLDSFGIIKVDLAKLWPAIFIVVGINMIISGVLKSRDKNK